MLDRRAGTVHHQPSPPHAGTEHLGARFDWFAVDHHNTDNPHTHVLMRGVTDDGKMLNIAGDYRDYNAHGVRERASEIVTLELGRQTEQEVSRQFEREVEAERSTRLDRTRIAAQDRDEFSDLRPDERIVGCVIAKGLGGDELGERIGLTIDGADGRVHRFEAPQPVWRISRAAVSSRSSRR